jgi:hypothetical protein
MLDIDLLMYVISLSIKPSFKLSIHNQCGNVDLVSPINIIGDGLECYRPLDRKVCAGEATRFSFNILGNALNGILAYQLQRRQSHVSTKIDKSAAHILIIWRVSKFKEFFAYVLLMEHEKELDDLKELQRKNMNRFKLCSEATTETWSLNDNVALITTFGVMNEGHLLNITISEAEGDNGARRLVRIDPER